MEKYMTIKETPHIIEIFLELTYLRLTLQEIVKQNPSLDLEKESAIICRDRAYDITAKKFNLTPVEQKETKNE